jgi:ABC-type uncharacterized transport system auxiliary subunit
MKHLGPGMKHLGIVILVLAGLTGCLGSAPPVPRDHYYRVMVDAPGQAAHAQTASLESVAIPGQPGSGAGAAGASAGAVTLPGVLSVAPLDAEGLLRERPLLYSATGGAHELQQHDYHYWMDPPPRMLQLQLVDYLRASGLAQSVVTPDLRIESDYQVSGRIKRLERLLGGGPVRVVAEIELSMVSSADNRLMVIGSYAAEAVADDDGVESSVLALNRALGQVFERFLTDAARSQ